MRGSQSAVAKAIESFQEFETKPSKRKTSGFCGSSHAAKRSADDDDFCKCMNQKCCGGYNKCNKNRYTCTSCGFNCVAAAEIMPWNQDLKKGDTCEEKYGTSTTSICDFACGYEPDVDQEE